MGVFAVIAASHYGKKDMIQRAKIGAKESIMCQDVGIRVIRQALPFSIDLSKNGFSLREYFSAYLTCMVGWNIRRL